MTSIRIKQAPHEHFDLINAQMDGWEQTFVNLIAQRKNIRYSAADMPTLPQSVMTALARGGYVHLIIESDDSKNFLLPCD